MNIDLGSLFFNASIETGGGTPSWGTALGQSSPDYKLTYPGAADILVAMDYCYYPLSNDVSCKLGKGGKEYKAIDSQQRDSNYEIIKAALFSNVQIKIEKSLISIDKPFVLLVTKENVNTHKGRRTLKYSDSARIGEFCNRDFFDAVQETLGGPNVCWFAYAIDVEEQNKLIISVIKVSDSQESYANPETRKKTWISLLPASIQTSSDAQNFFVFNFSSSHKPSQIIYYGVPGCGKSYEVNKEIDGKLVGIQDKEYHKVRCVFHPEYSNADFVGQIYPKIEEKTNEDGSTSSVVVYEFKPGPFAEIVRRAYQNPDEPFFLIIEEINRGNAAAIFGESFQLLDRIKVGEPADDSTENVYGEGWSSYGIDNQDVNAYIRDQQRKNADKQKGHCSCVKGGCSDVEQESKLRSYPFVDISSEKLNTTWVRKDGGAEKREEKTLHFSANTAIRLPPNLSIYATMNTSDQNVITMDNAFQRRFKSRMIRNNLKNAAQYNIKIEGTNVYWGAFRKWVNDKILFTPVISKADDKCLGGWFISTPVEAKDDDGNVTKFKDIKREDFAEKVIKYLWDDVFKRNAATVIFKKGSGNGEFKSLSELIDAFENEAGQSTESFDKVFKLSDDDKRNLIKDINEESQQVDLAGEGSVEGETVTDA